MKRTFAPLIFVFAMIFHITVFSAPTATSKELVIYVAPYGSDGNEGTMDRPLQTFEGAKNAVRKCAGSRLVRVIFRKGTYYINNTLKFNSLDSGRENAVVSYEAYEGEDVRISGTTKLDTQRFFPVSDFETLMRIPPDARNKVVQMDLTQFGIVNLGSAAKFCSDIFKTRDDLISHTLGYLILDNKEQVLAQWPNGDGNFAKYTKSYAVGITTGTTTNLADAGIFGYSEYEPDKWMKAEDAYVHCFPNNDYHSECLSLLKVDTIEKKIFVGGGGQGFTGGKSKRWKVLNLIEELDVPGEWYIDRDKMILYYYPPADMSEKSQLEFTSIQQQLMEFNGCAFIRFKGLDIGRCNKNAMVIDNYTHDIDITDCIFKSIGISAINAQSGESLNFIKKGGYYFTVKGVYNINVNRNVFMDIGFSAIQLYSFGLGTNRKTNINIFNNYFTRIMKLKFSRYAVNYRGSGLNISNNLIHNINVGGISGNASESSINYNEIYNACRQISDCGGIYQGMQYVFWNTEIAYNLLYRIVGRFDISYRGYRGIYQDDCASGSYPHHNFIMDQPGGMTLNGGKYHVYDNNVILNIEENKNISTNNRGEQLDWNDYINRSYMDEVLDNAANIPIMAKIYPEFYEMLKAVRAPSSNVITDNISNSPFIFDKRVEELGIINNNTYVTDLNNFVDADHYDLRLKMGTELQKNHPNALNEENFDMSSIGIDWDLFKRLDKSFSKMYPINGSKEIDNQNCTLMWSEADGADKYEVTIAKDKEMKDVVVRETSYYNYYDCSGLDSGNTQYYWTVRAINDRRNYETSWEADGDVFSFYTVAVDGNDTRSLEEAIANAKVKIQTIKDGVNYEAGTYEKAENAVKKAEAIYKSQTITRNMVKSAVFELNYVLQQCTQNLIVQFENTTNLFNSADNFKETASYGAVLDVKDGALCYDTNSSKNGSNGFSTKEKLERDKIYCFKAKIDYGNSWGGFSIRHQSPQKIAYSGDAYLIIVKKSRIELQRNGMGYVAVAVNDGIINDGQWHDMAFGAVNTLMGTRVIFMVDGRTIFDVVDSDNKISDPGHFSVASGSQGYNFSFKPADSIPKLEIVTQPTDVNYSKIDTSTDLNGNEIINASVIFNTSGEGQLLSIYENASDSYSMKVKDDAIYLLKKSGGEETILCAADNKYIVSGREADIRFGAYKSKQANRIVFAVDGKMVIDFFDIIPISSMGKFVVASLNGADIIISGGKNVPYFFNKNMLSEGNSVVKQLKLNSDINTDTKKQWTITSDFAQSKFYYWKDISEGGDKNAKITVMCDYDLGQTDDEVYLYSDEDFTRGKSGWQYLTIGAAPKVIVTVEGSGYGRLLTGENVGFTVADESSVIMNSLFGELGGLYILKSETNKVLSKGNEQIIGSNVTLVKKDFMVPVSAATIMGADVQCFEGGVKVTKGDNVSTFTAKSTGYTVNGEGRTAANECYINENDELMVAAYALADAVGKKLYDSYCGIVMFADSFPDKYILPNDNVDKIIKQFYMGSSK